MLLILSYCYFLSFTGLNLLNLIHNALNSPDMVRVEDQPQKHLAFFDFMGIYMIVYQVSFASTLNALLMIISLVDMILRNKDSGMFICLFDVV